ncbi:hypothetical protein P1P70_12055 [Streptomyces sp. MB09-02B]|nr:hypothetical protein [Streptomyces sp. MB09-02B]MDX3640159.1 hypothetical protein [Streptomyces sp. MB09-02B]
MKRRRVQVFWPLQGFQALKEARVGGAACGERFLGSGFPGCDVFGRAAECIGYLVSGQTGGFAPPFAFAGRGQGDALRREVGEELIHARKEFGFVTVVC